MRRLGLVVAALALLLVTAPLALAPTPGRAAPVRAAAPAARPNVVLVVMDDFSMDLLPTMRSARTMARRGASYPYSFVVDSLCCVSRASTFTGQYPHQTGVLTNTSAGSSSGLGGWAAFTAGGNPQRSVGVALQRAGYTTGFVGKYLNEYEWNPGWRVPPRPPGWTDFRAVFGSAYDGWDFASTRSSGTGLAITQHPAPPASADAARKDAAYAGTVISEMALGFVAEQERAGQPYFLQVAPYAPHNRVNPQPHYPGDPLFPAAFADRPGKGNCGAVACRRLGVRDLPGFGDRVGDNRPVTRRGRPARAWNTTGGRTSRAAAAAELRQRAQMAQSVDRMVAALLDAVGENTYVVLTSDNGFHLGQVGMRRGKGTPYDTDSRVPLLVVGPRVAPGERAEVVSNLDLAPTLEEIAGLTPQPYRAGTSLVPTFADPALARRDVAFMEHTQQTLATGDPDAAFSGDELDRIPSWTAVRSRDALLVRLDLAPSAARTRWGYEFYSYAELGWERRNQFTGKRHTRRVRALLTRLKAFEKCRSVRGSAPVPDRCRALTLADGTA